MLIVTRWLWAERSLTARLARLALLPPSWLYRAAAALRVRAYRSRLLRQAIPPVPTVAVGNLTVGGSGKTPVTAWIAGYYARAGVTPGVVLRGYGGDEADVHRARVPEAVVVENPNRIEGARAAVAQGAQVVVLDDAFQRLDVGRDLNIAVVSAESDRAVRWTLPAGPWREGWRALDRADLVVITRKRADRASAEAMARRVALVVPEVPVAIAHLDITGFKGLLSDRFRDLSEIDGARIVAAGGVADPDTFAMQCRGLGAEVRLLPWRDHQRVSPGEIGKLLEAMRGVDYVVITEKDAAKVREHWPAQAPEPLVARLDVAWERGRIDVETALDLVVTDVHEL